MVEPATVEALSAAAADVLETMFFSPVLGEGVPAAPAASGVAARLRFTGGRSGIFSLRVSSGAAQIIAANFLGEETEHPDPGQVSDVISELANMMCGAVLSRMDREAHFDLGPPELVESLETAGSVSRAFDIGEGEVAVFLKVEP
jgi:CheY-specific phosphatase CheX